MQNGKDSKKSYFAGVLLRRFTIGLDLIRALFYARHTNPWHIDQDLTDVQMPEYFELMMADFSSALDTPYHDERFIRLRLDMIFTLLLARALKEKGTNGHDSMRAPTGSALSYSGIYTIPCWMIDKRLALLPTANPASHLPEITVDYILRYGQGLAKATNLVVLRKQTIRPDEHGGLLALMSSVQRKRKNAGEKRGIYGLHTDTCCWNFFHLTHRGKYSHKLNLSWDTDRAEIIGLICQIIRKANTLAEEVGGIDVLAYFINDEAELTDEISVHS
ncbi:hypothetical protein ASPBRDRAFT_208746 [Aspergillus brasiliensis CBS 101740]|uniref:Uncharacterized protein n=1 Tax=Aspergillus brasiliensis (strain CBS 101740 / IMI 381727 / IBT 21946) TaxID=767769 RepID=A0A1L9UEI3_ASPBC|nr:hypothetical protein ASPBRDRAFT_208746 [Aspergillus brasiliensis CBS 101740]